MSVKLRLQRLEDSRKATDEVSCEARMERTRQAKQWIEDMTKSIQQGSPMPQFPESDITDSPKQRKANRIRKSLVRRANKTEIGT